ncbi:hypothetical protein OSB04_006266 [Centaurea solstitialis]|uniref:Knottins-like domain-containing protein n=1 Tax=Centaurea solstitialis TaxID=347529 RepID=A0AA38TVE7_9ASTR|nr:hypothetical protein OSB04_006266 [Centaurea solstitialis]
MFTGCHLTNPWRPSLSPIKGITMWQTTTLDIVSCLPRDSNPEFTTVKGKVCEKPSKTWSGKCKDTAKCDKQCIEWEDARHGACQRRESSKDLCYCYFDCKDKPPKTAPPPPPKGGEPPAGGPPPPPPPPSGGEPPAEGGQPLPPPPGGEPPADAGQPPPA